MLRDAVGVEFEVGQVITYPGRWSSTLYVRTAVVKEVREHGLAVEVFEVCFASPRGYYVRTYNSSIERTIRATISVCTAFELRYQLEREAEEKTQRWHERTAARNAR